MKLQHPLLSAIVGLSLALGLVLPASSTQGTPSARDEFPLNGAGIPVQAVSDVEAVTGNALPIIPHGNPNEISVVASRFTLASSGSIFEIAALDVLVRNNTRDWIAEIEGSAIIRGDGHQEMTESIVFTPIVVRPGGLAFARILVEGSSINEIDSAEYFFSSEEPGESYTETYARLTIAEFQFADGVATGIAENESKNDIALDRSIFRLDGMYALCFSEDGTMTGAATMEFGLDRVDSGGRTPFSAFNDYDGVETCDRFLVIGMAGRD